MAAMAPSLALNDTHRHDGAIMKPLDRKDSGFGEPEYDNLCTVVPTFDRASLSSELSLSDLSVSTASLAAPSQCYRVPSNYRQAFIVRRDRLFLDRAACSDKSFERDGLDAEYDIDHILRRHSRPAITISEGTVTANFPLLPDTGRRSLVGRNLNLAAGKRIIIVVKVPFPRSFRAIYATRRTIQDVVSLLRAASSIPPVRLAFSMECRSHVTPGYFAILMGPFHKLSARTWLNIDCHCVLDPASGERSPISGLDAEARRAVSLISDAIVDSSATRITSPHVLHQQLTLGVKLELLHVENLRQHDVEVGDSDDESQQSRPFDVMRPSDARRIETAMADLVDFYDHNPFRTAPQWLISLQQAMRLEKPNAAILRIMNSDLFPQTPLNVARDWVGGLQIDESLLCWTEIGLW